MELNKILQTIPQTPGIYKMLDTEGRVIYVGKAKELSKRVRQYFKPDYAHSTRTRKLVENISDIKVIETDSELEAIILENNLIKQLQPKYNIIMKDDKNFVYIRITKEAFPRIQIVRQIEKDGAKYIGPKTAQHKVKDTLKFLKKLFPFRHCNLNIDENFKVTNKVLKYPCLDYYIKRCVAPCIAKCTQEEYAEIIKNAVDFLEGRTDEIIKNLTSEMHTQANAKEFEKAARTRDKLEKIHSILQKQKVSSTGQENTDIINYTVIQGTAYFNLFQIRSGILTESLNFTLKADELEENESESKEILSAFLKQYYQLATDIPKEILIPHEIDTSELPKYNFQVPKIGTKNRLLDMSLKNAKIFADRSRPSWKEQSELTIKDTEALQEILKLEKPIKRLECFDISHLGGTDTVASMIVFRRGAPDKSHYRKFHVRTVKNKPDDFASMEEVLTRRLYYLREKFAKENIKIKKSGETYTLTQDDQPIASGQLTETDAKSALIQSDPNLTLLKELVKKAKAKRIYALPAPEDQPLYETAGFLELKQKTATASHYYDKVKLKQDKSFSETPDLILIDGGKGQLSAAQKALGDLPIPMISLAKRFEEIYTPNSPQPIILPEHHPARRLLQRARDEAHRFAITFQKDMRSKKIKNNQQ